MNKLGINLWNWQPMLSDACLGLPTKAAELGFTAVELPMTVSCISDALRDEIRDTGLAVSLCAALGEGRDISNFDPKVREETFNYMKEVLHTGASLGAYVFAGPLYAGGGKRHKLSDDDRKREWDLAVEGLRYVSHIARESGVLLAVEPLNRYRTSVVNTVEQAIKLINDVGEDNVGIHYDTYHAALEEADLLVSLEQALKSGKIYHFHACANNRGCPGEGIIPWETVLYMLMGQGYEGHITMETFAPGGLDASWVNVHGDPDELAARGIYYLNTFYKKNCRDSNQRFVCSEI